VRTAWARRKRRQKSSDYRPDDADHTKCGQTWDNAISFRKFTVPEAKLGETFLVGWAAQSLVGHKFSCSVEPAKPGTEATTIDSWVRAECLLTSAYHWSGLSEADRKIKADLTERSLRQRYSLPSDT